LSDVILYNYIYYKLRKVTDHCQMSGGIKQCVDHKTSTL
jgi:hypothetical protein